MAPAKKPIPIDEIDQFDAFERIKSELDALDPSTLLHINVDAQEATSIVLEALPALRDLRPQLEKHLPTFDLERFDRLEDYALALNFTHTAIQSEMPALDRGLALRSDATKLRIMLLGDARVLVQRGLIDAGKLAPLQGGTGYRVLAQDLNLLRAVCIRPVLGILFRGAGAG